MFLSWFDCAHHRSTQMLSTDDPEPRRMGQGGQFRTRLDSRLKHAGMTDFGYAMNSTRELRGIDPQRLKRMLLAFGFH